MNDTQKAEKRPRREDKEVNEETDEEVNEEVAKTEAATAVAWARYRAAWLWPGIEGPLPPCPLRNEA